MSATTSLPPEVIESCRSWSVDGFVNLYRVLQRDYDLPQHLYPLALALCDWRIMNLMQICGPGSGKSTLTSQVFPGAVLGHDPTQTILCISGAEDLASGFQEVCASYIADHEGFREIFPAVKPDKQRGWSNERGIFVTGRRAASPDASFRAFGVKSKVMTGKHGTLILIDDVHTEENSSSEEQCNELARTFVMSIAGRQDPRGARMVITGRRWHERDLYGRLKDNGDFVVLTLPYERENSRRLWYDVTIPEGLSCVFTDGQCMAPDGTVILNSPEIIRTAVVANRHPKIEHKEGGVTLRHIEWPYGVDPKSEGFFWPNMPAKRKEYFSAKRLEPIATRAVYQCDPSAKTEAVFLREDFSWRYIPVENQELGVQNPAVAAICRQNGSITIQSWDTAFSSTAASDHSVCVTLLLTPCDEYHCGEDPEKYGPCERHFDISVLDVWRDRVGYAEVEQQVRAMYQLWQPAIVGIENRAYGVGVIENLQAAGMPIEAVNPGPLESKRGRAVEGVFGGSVQGWCRMKRVRLPEESAGKWVNVFLDELTSFTGAKGGTDDQVDALVHGVRWAIKNGGGADLPSEWGDASKVDDVMRQGMPVDHMASMIAGYQNLAFDPFGECCGRCRHYVGLVRDRNLPGKAESNTRPRDWCILHGRPTQAIGGCEDHMDPDDSLSHPFWTMN